MNSRRQKTGVQTTELSFGQLLHQLREKRELSLAALAAGASVSKGYLSNLEHDIRSPSPEIAEAIDRALDAGGELAELAVPRPRTRATRERVRPAQLPAALRSFVPRREILDRAAAELAAHEGLIALDGPAGVGKTAFTVHWAHAIAR